MEYIATYKINEEIHKDKLCQADFDFFFKYINKKKFTFVSLVPVEDEEENEKYFGVVRWCSEDIKNALEVNSVPVTPENVGKLLDAVNTHHFTDHMISAGWDYIYEMINNVDFEQKEENIRFCEVCGKPMISGFVVGDGAEYYCSESCLHRVYTKEEYNEMYTEGYAFWTEWEE